MKTQEIPRQEWPTFFKDFSRIHLGQKTNLWICSPDTGLMREAVGLPLIGVASDRSATGQERIDVIVGDSPDAHVTHQVLQPISARLSVAVSGYQSSLQIESREGTIAFVRLATEAANATPPAFA